MIIMRINKSNRRNLNFKIINTNFKNFLLIFSLALKCCEVSTCFLVFNQVLSIGSIILVSQRHYSAYTHTHTSSLITQVKFYVHTYYTHVITQVKFYVHTHTHTSLNRYNSMYNVHTYYTHVITQVKFYVQCTYTSLHR